MLVLARCRQWRALMAAFETSGVSQREFCARHGLARSTFDLWRRRLRVTRATDAPGVQSDALFVELTAPAADKSERRPIDCAWEMELELGAGVVLRLRRGAAC